MNLWCIMCVCISVVGCVYVCICEWVLIYVCNELYIAVVSTTYCAMDDNCLVGTIGERHPQNITNVNWSLLLHRVVVIETIQVEVTEHIHPIMRYDHIGIM